MKVIVLCGSVTAYQKVIEVKHQLEKLGFEVLVPDLALEMEHIGDYSLQEETNAQKTAATRAHFEKIAQSDVVLIVNQNKHGIEGYIGPAVLMEMGVAFHLGKPIYLLYQPAEVLTNYTEIMALEPKLLFGNLEEFTP
jgi:nucleoside 2-deoxyribosyltransferase